MTWDDAAFRAEVEATLERFLDDQAGPLAPLGGDATRLLAEARTSVAGGKRFRASFCWWGFRTASPAVADRDGLLRACAALEVLHASALVHDDLMDGSDTRRGRTATHRALAAEHAGAGWPGDSERYGAAAAILLGDLLLTWSDQMIRTSSLANPRALAVFDLCRTEVIAGQFLDVSVQARGDADVTTAMTVLRYKSAKYSIERPLHIGAALGGADDEQLRRLTAYGLPLGEAFQLRDDLLGVYGDPGLTGKPAGDDLIEGKRTVLVALALDGADPAARARIDGALGRQLTPAEVDELRALITASGAREQVEAAITDLVERSLDALDAAGFDDRATAVLRSLAAAATDRAV